MSRQVGLLLMASLITLQVGGSISIYLMVSPSSIKTLNWDHKIQDMKIEKDKQYPISLLRRDMWIDDGVFLRMTKRGTGEALRKEMSDNALKDYNDWAIKKYGRLWDDNLIRRLKRGLPIWENPLVRMI